MSANLPKRRILATSAVALLVAVPSAWATTITVSTTLDTVANDGQCSLREAITAAATDTPSGTAAGECPAGAGANTIVLGPNHYVLSRTGAPDDTNVNGDLDVTAGTLTITGAGAVTQIDGAGIDRVLDVLAPAALTLRNLTVTGGKAPAGADGSQGDPAAPGSGTDSKGADGSAGGDGGGIRSAGTLTLSGVTVTNNHAGDGGHGGGSSVAGSGGTGAAGGGTRGGRGGAGGGGGGLFSTGTTTIVASTFDHDFSGNGGDGGGALNAARGGDATGNGAGGSGGECFAGSGGSGGAGGAIATGAGTLLIARSTVQQNLAGSGGAGGGCGLGGTGGSGSGSGAGGQGGFSFGGGGGEGGSGGGVAASATQLTLTDSTISANTAGGGGAPGTSAGGGAGGTGGAGTGGGGPGSFTDAGSGGGGGSGGGLVVFSTNAGNSTATVDGLTLVGNTAGAGVNGADATQGGSGGGNGGGGGGVGAPGDSSGGSGGFGGAGGGADIAISGFSFTNVTATGNQAGTGATGGAGGAGPGSSAGGFGGEGGSGGGIDAFAGGSMAHVTVIGDNVASGGAGGAAGTGSPATPGFNEGPGRGADIEGPSTQPVDVGLSASILGSCGGVLGDGGGNIAAVGNAGCPGLVADPQLGPLADNGGPTKTMALAAASPAVNLIKVPCGTTPDQRGVARPQGAGCDAGAYEFAPPTVLTGGVAGGALTGRVNPNARATTWHFEYGATTAYGKRTPDKSLAPGLSPVGVSAKLAGLRAGHKIHYRLVASNADGTAHGADATFAVAARFGGVRILGSTFLVGRGGVVRVRLSCPRSAAKSCTGKLSASVKGNLGNVRFRIASGAGKTLALVLNRRGRRMISASGRRGALVVLSASASDARGLRVVTRRSVRLKRVRR